MDCQNVISEKQLPAKAGRGKKSTRREDRRDKKNDNPNAKKKQNSREELKWKIRAEFILTKQGAADKSQWREEKKVRWNDKKEVMLNKKSSSFAKARARKKQ
jgi:hypothetical protein